MAFWFAFAGAGEQERAGFQGGSEEGETLGDFPAVAQDKLHRIGDIWWHVMSVD